MSKIGFIGLGRMGRPMAGNLLRGGYELLVHDINREAVQALEQQGASGAGDLAEMATQCDIIFTVLPTDREVAEVCCDADSIIDHAQPGTLIVDMSTIDPQATDRLAATLAQRSIRFADAPIGRLASHADAGECLFMVGASDEDFQRIEPMLRSMGTAIHHCGDVGSGIRTKLVNNYLAISSCYMNAEALTLAQRFGLDLEKTLEVIHGTTATNGQLKLNYASKVLAGDTAPGFQIDLAHKDLSLVVNAANDAQVPLQLGAAAREGLSIARSNGWGGNDFSALLDAHCELAGVDKMRFPADGAASKKI